MCAVCVEDIESGIGERINLCWLTKVCLLARPPLGAQASLRKQVSRSFPLRAHDEIALLSVAYAIFDRRYLIGSAFPITLWLGQSACHKGLHGLWA